MAPTRLGDHPEWWRVRDVMTTDVARVRPDATYDEIVDVLTARGVSGLPVTDEGGRLVGIVTAQGRGDHGRGPDDPDGGDDVARRGLAEHRPAAAGVGVPAAPGGRRRRSPGRCRVAP
jgi:hypothetical protein